MIAILKKEIQSFFASPVGYLVIGIFLVVCGLFLFVFSGSYNILDSGFADLSPFFSLAPWIFIFLIPGITMKSFSEEKKQGTMEILLSRPLSVQNLVMGKFTGALVLALIAILPSLLYVYSVYELGAVQGNLDSGATLGSYLGLLLLAASYTAIGIFTSSLTSSQVTAFISAVFLCFLCFFAFEGLAGYDLFPGAAYGIEYLAMNFHYKSLSRGVVDSRDVIYFLSLILLFLTLTHFTISKSKR